MTDVANDTGAKTPWHLWAVGLISLIWNSYGCYDYFMSKTGGDAYLKQAGMSDAQISAFNAMPAWTTVFWALGVWGSLAGSVLLLLRSKWAVQAFAASLLGLAVSLVYSYGLSDNGKLGGQQGMIMYAVIVVSLLIFLEYARRMAKAGVLR